MPHPLQQQVAAVGRRARRMLWLYGLSWVVGGSLLAALLLGSADYVIRFQDPGIRIIVSGLLLATGGWTAFRYLLRPLSHRLRDVDVAQRIERRYPQLNERLSSAVEFLEQSEHDPTAGSAALRRAVIHEAAAELERLDLTAVIDRRPARRALWAAGGVVLAVLLFALLDPASTRLALVRLAAPLGSTQWPQKHHLEFKNPPTRLALGQPFEVELVDRNRNLPDEVQIHYRFADGPDRWSEEVDKMKYSNGAMIANREGVTRPFEYRAVGGDDRSMEWIRLEVIEPPLVESFQVTLHPPAYTGWGPTKSDKRIRALKGSRVELRGAATKPLAEAEVKLDGGKSIAAQVQSGEFEFRVRPDDWLIEQSGAYWFALTDTEGLSGGRDERWDVRAVPDAPPSVSLEQPATHLYVTPEAVVPIKLLVKDDLGLHNITLVYSRSDHSEKGEFTVILYQGPPQVAANPEGSLSGGGALGESRVVDYAWNLAELQLAPGVQLQVTARASDYLPQIGQTAAPRRISIITPAQLEDRLAERQALILGELARAVALQREVRGQTSALQIQLGEVGQISKRDLDDLQAAELNQRQVTRTLTSVDEGIPVQIASLLADMESNRVDSPEIERRMRQFQTELARLDQEQLPTIHRELTAGFKSGQAALDDPAEPATDTVAASLATAGQAQDEVVQSLERLLGDLAEWADYRRFARDVRQIQQAQGEVQRRTQQLGQETLAKDLKELSPQQRAELQKLSREQLELARQLDRTLQGMEEMGDRLAEKDPLAAATLDDALHEARKQAISGQMRQSGKNLEQNRLGQAAAEQQRVGDRLAELLDILANRREHELSRLVEKLRGAEAELQRLREQQRGLQKKIKAAEKNPDAAERKRQLERLRREQKELAAEVDRLARQLKRLTADRAGRSAERGAAQMGKSAESGEQGDAAAAEQQAKQAENDLDEAQEQLAQARQKAEADLADELLARFEDALKGLHDRQQRAWQETQRLDRLRARTGALTRAQIVSLNDLARQQGAIADETAAHGEKMKSIAVFRLALDGAADSMRGAAEVLLQQETGAGAQRRQQNALARLQQLMDALAEDDDEKGQKQKGEQGGQSGGQQQQGEALHDLAELKLLKLLQADLARRTIELRERAVDWSGDDRREAEQLAVEQGRLADLVFDLLQPAAGPAGDDDPAALPELDEGLREEDLPPLELGP